jgi:hypothetical protein
MESNKWIDHIYPPNSQNEVMAFVSLLEAVKDIQLNNAVDDEIK